LGTVCRADVAIRFTRLEAMSLEPWIEELRLETPCDEAGRGCLAGPVTAASVILPPAFAVQLVREGILDDSKKLSKKVRDALRIRIESESVAWAVGESDQYSSGLLEGNA